MEEAPKSGIAHWVLGIKGSFVPCILTTGHTKSWKLQRLLALHVDRSNLNFLWHLSSYAGRIPTIDNCPGSSNGSSGSNSSPKALDTMDALTVFMGFMHA